ncbi:hypothetical protein ACFX11_016158 [Malus domestica]
MAAVDLKKSAKTLTAGDEIPIPISQSQSRRLIANPSFRSETHSQVSDFMALRQVFNFRLIHFFALHPEACDVLDAILVEPFSQRQRVVVAQTEKTQLLASPSPTPSDGVRNNKNGQNKVQLPALLTPRRPMPSCDAEHETINSQSTSCYTPAKRILNFSHSEDYYKVVNQNIPKTTETPFEDENVTFSLEPQKEKSKNILIFLKESRRWLIQNQLCQSLRRRGYKCTSDCDKIRSTGIRSSSDLLTEDPDNQLIPTVHQRSCSHN